MSEPREPVGREDDDGAIIRPVGYQPREETSEAGFKLSKAQLIIVAVLIPTLIGVWFLFTAKSVRLTFEPAVESVSVHGGLSIELGGIFLLRAGDYQVNASAAFASSARRQPSSSASRHSASRA